MFYRKEGNPENSEVVLCTVTKILPNAVFVRIDEYDKGGMIHISEIAPGRIRNLNDYVYVDKKIVCKVLRTDEQKGHIDLSLRRVNEGQRRDKVNQLKKEQKAEKIIEMLANSIKRKPEDLYKEITKNVFAEYEYLHEFFEDVVNGEEGISYLKLPNKLEEALHELVAQKMAPSEIQIKGNITLKIYSSNGVDLIHETFDKMKDKAISVKYLGTGKYSITLSDYEYEKVEKLLSKKVEKAIEWFKEQGGEAKFVRA